MMGAQHVPRPSGNGKQAIEGSVGETPKQLDLVHLSCQTFGDPDLERDVLRLFLDQVESTSRALRATSDAIERGRLFHLVKGSARGVGAFQLAALAQVGEADPLDDANLADTLIAIEHVSARVGALLAS
jgi:HPt (histidine-containing phosphotransfer) domain-containing protein